MGRWTERKRKQQRGVLKDRGGKRTWSRREGQMYGEKDSEEGRRTVGEKGYGVGEWSTLKM